MLHSSRKPVIIIGFLQQACNMDKKGSKAVVRFNYP